MEVGIRESSGPLRFSLCGENRCKLFALFCAVNPVCGWRIDVIFVHCVCFIRFLSILDKMMSVQSLKMAVLILAWLGATVTTVILNKYIFQTMEWQYPISLTVVHMIVCVLGSLLTLRVFKAVPFTVINNQEYLSGVLPLAYVSSLLFSMRLSWTEHFSAARRAERPRSNL